MVTGDPYAPSRGEIVWLQFTPRAGHEQSGRRPAVIISPREYNQSDQLKSLDWKARQARRIGSLPGRSIKEIQARILALVQ